MAALLALLTRAAVHSTVAAAVVEVLISLWRETEPLGRYRLRLLALVLPPFTAPLAPLARTAGWPTLLRLSPWAGLEIASLPLTWLAAGAFASMVLLFIVQELLPWRAERRREASLRPVSPDGGTRIAAAVREVFGAPVPCYELGSRARSVSVRRIEGRDALCFGAGFPGWLDDLELRAVLAHERAHVVRRDLSTRRWLYALRVAQVHAPFALIEYRQLIDDSEEACDAIAARTSGTPMALASALIKAHGGAAAPRAGAGVLARAARRLERHARSVRVRRRVRRLLDGPATARSRAFAALATGAALAAILLGVV